MLFFLFMERNNAEDLVTLLLDEFWERLPTNFVPRSVRIPRLPGKIDVLIGMRRCGKTYRVYQQIHQLLSTGVPRSAILYLNLEDDRLLPVDGHALAKLLEAFYARHPENHDRLCYIFLDEIQNADGWPAVVRRFLDTRQVHLTLTGSSAKLLSREIATSLRGRSIATEVWPFSFHEYLQATANEPALASKSPRSKDRMQAHLKRFLQIGGLPEVTDINDLDRKRVLQDYVSVVVLKDLVERHRIKNEALLSYFVKMLLGHVGQPLSLNKIANDLKSQGRKIGKNTLYQYLDYIRDCYLAFDVTLFSESVRKRQVHPRKIYSVDTGLARAQSFSLSENVGRLFENLVFLDLKRAGYGLGYYLTQRGAEVDFIAKTPDGKARAIQVCAAMADKQTKAREEAALQEAQAELGITGEIVTLETYPQFQKDLLQGPAS